MSCDRRKFLQKVGLTTAWGAAALGSVTTAASRPDENSKITPWGLEAS